LTVLVTALGKQSDDYLEAVTLRLAGKFQQFKDLQVWPLLLLPAANDACSDPVPMHAGIAVAVPTTG
jgi:hypothetical protein